ncbi:hypothetical protein [Paenibacillus sp. 481]|uniref:hypothetical protein n=1 Tax=Paenibacillus sp. 481 TaxID=2835869 RepID=UPI001E424631|nr:hypothetical protein [Paenibacillus sp. 481]
MATGCTVGILGVTHDPMLREKYNFSLDLMKELIVAFNPDVICGEVLPEYWEWYQQDQGSTEQDRKSTKRGYRGEPASEYWDLIFPLCEEINIAFEPMDWMELDVWADFDPFQRYDGAERLALQEELERWQQRQFATVDCSFSSSAIPFNSCEYDIVTKQMYEWLERVNPQAHMFRWICRHLIMIQRIKNAIKKHAGKRMLCIAGADHNYMFVEALRQEKGVHLVYPLRNT